MKSIKNYLLPLIITVILSFLFWIWTSHTWTDYINVLFYVSLISFILLFIILLVQEGIFDVTSYGFRRLTYQLSSNSKKKSMKDDAFFNPKNAKKEHYMISSWVLPSLCINILLVIVTIIVSFTI
ncbi:DUF3899 domain-containing protein [Staphylococcus pasteuri]|uniref:DUF3899 domain-containing protein n=1 Tax=Staphylococcus pasteuri TaxID=45972 RepID=UPI0008699F65|nr:DUF3899 domain-containing protein [Staphylococcus pasteuri]ODB80782.1 hypothetical protein A9N02_01735 [Staphylococcus sp. AOAB]RQX26918.1 DUF3899 domain-containing protein [Staphylococcus warneri]MCO0862162.1 DUF3899 domain-containing protein [Staphylococcus pasteuri]MCO5358968.1 DUF3899 domain-containing protein [Staphylococcus pasteuri]MEB7434109.1 DUF3899 domain-containing protein [Staphylococcus pasteuri]